MKYSLFGLLAILIMLLAGCVSFPQTVDEFRASSPEAQTFTTNRSLKDTYELIANNLVSCQKPVFKKPISVSGNFYELPSELSKVEGKIDEVDGSAVISSEYFNPVASGFLLVIDFKRNTINETAVSVHKLDNQKVWTTAAHNIESWFSGGKKCL